MENFPINIDMYVTVVGLLLPVLIATIVAPDWTKQTKGWVSFGLVLLAAAGHLFFMGDFNVADFPGTFLKILFLTAGSYLSFWRPSGIGDVIEKNVGVKGNRVLGTYGESGFIRLNYLCMLTGLAALLIFGCSITRTVDWRKLDTPVKRYHFAQLSFEDMQKDYIAMFPGQPEETRTYLREHVAPVLHKAKLALDAWGEVVTGFKPDTGQESAFTKLVDELAILLKSYIVKEE